MKRLIADIEANGLWTERPNELGEKFPRATVIHCICLKEVGSKEPVKRFHNGDFRRDGDLADGLVELSTADLLIFHNGQHYDLPVIQGLIPEWKWNGELYDTLIASHLMFPWLGSSDWKLWHRGRFPKELVGWHSLEAWGHRLKMHKGEFGKGPESLAGRQLTC